MAQLNSQDVYALVKKIPRGNVASYGQLAKLLGFPRHARHVGYALANTPTSAKIPWHRVINALGAISLRRKNWQSGSDDLQRILLEAEGIAFDANGRIDLQRYGWKDATYIKVKNKNSNNDGHFQAKIRENTRQ
jgi:methylated-DNA-protein-cysteine methyltransferase related protein